MSTHKALTARPAAPTPEPVVGPVEGVASNVPVEAAANDDRPTGDFSIAGDPLWGMAIASIILFATLAALMAMS